MRQILLTGGRALVSIWPMLRRPGRPRSLENPDRPTADQIINARIQAGLSARDAAAILGVSPRTWQRWETGVSGMPPERWRDWRDRIAAALITRTSVRRGRPARSAVGNCPGAAVIRAARVQAGLTRALAAAMVNVSARTWQRWEAGETIMPPEDWQTWLALVEQDNTVRPPLRRGRPCNRPSLESPSSTEIRAARLASRLSLEAAAKYAFVSRRTWQRWEMGLSGMPPERWREWSARIAAGSFSRTTSRRGRPLRSLDCDSPAAAEIRAARVKAGLTRELAAAMINVSARTWQRWEAGDTIMPSRDWRTWLALVEQDTTVRPPIRRGRPCNRPSPGSPCAAEIRTARLAAGLSLDTAAKYAFVSRRTWQRWERGESGICDAAWKAFTITVQSRLNAD